MPPTREELARIASQDQYRPTSTDSFCEVDVDDEFHNLGVTSSNYDNRAMWRLRQEFEVRHSQAAYSSNVHIGCYVCQACYLSLPEHVSDLPVIPRTRRVLGLSSKPPKKRRIPA
jgi:hypothetical protein